MKIKILCKKCGKQAISQRDVDNQGDGSLWRCPDACYEGWMKTIDGPFKIVETSKTMDFGNAIYKLQPYLPQVAQVLFVLVILVAILRKYL